MNCTRVLLFSRKCILKFPILQQQLLNGLFFCAKKGLPSRILRDNPNDARTRLEAISPDAKQSSVCQPRAISPYRADLQVVIATYNNAPYLVEAIESVRQQKSAYRVQLIVVDDGSTDQTPAILQSYQHDVDILIIRQPNAGVSAARNAALQHLAAPYVFFLDADDRIPPHTIASLLDKAFASDADIVEGSMTRFSEKTILGEQQHSGATNEALLGYACGKVFKTSLFTRVQFPVGYWFEDSIASWLLHPLAARTVTITPCTYLYRANPQGITHKAATRPKALDAVYVTEQMIRDAQELGLPLDQKAYEQLLDEIRLNFMHTCRLGLQVQKDVFTLSLYWIDTYFPAFTTTKKENKDLQQALDKRDFNAYLLSCCF